MEPSPLKLVRVPPPEELVAAGPRDKVRTLDEVAAIVEHLGRAGKVVVQAHGTFDLLHLGHVRHLEAARRFGDVLIVSVTADRFVNKGPGRPVFTETLRAEMIATLQYVDWVVINESPDAVSAIQRLRPHVYIKGQDYQNPEGDVTGKITKERDAVEAHGGRIEFTNEVTFSSTELINRHFNVFEPHIRDHLDALRRDGGLASLLDLIESVKDYRVLLVGDAIIDEYQYVLPMGKTPKENMIATRYQDRELFAGGVFAAANHIASFCAQVDVVTCLGTSGELRGPGAREPAPERPPPCHQARRRAHHAEAAVRRSLLHAQAVRSLFHGRRAAHRRPAGGAERADRQACAGFRRGGRHRLRARTARPVVDRHPDLGVAFPSP